MSAFLREYATSTTIYFPLITATLNNFTTGGVYSPTAGDSKISIDGGGSSNTTNLPTGVLMGNNALMWKMDLTSGELTGKTMIITIVDASTKAVEDQMIIIDTYGDGNGQLDLRDWADSLLKRDLSALAGEAARSLLNAIRFLRNKWSISGTTLTVTKEDDSTTAWTATLTATPGADPITGNDPT